MRVFFFSVKLFLSNFHVKWNLYLKLSSDNIYKLFIIFFFSMMLYSDYYLLFTGFSVLFLFYFIFSFLFQIKLIFFLFFFFEVYGNWQIVTLEKLALDKSSNVKVICVLDCDTLELFSYVLYDISTLNCPPNNQWYYHMNYRNITIIII